MADARAVINLDINTSDAAASLRALQAQINSFTSALNKNNTAHAFASKQAQTQLTELVNASRFFTAETIKMSTAAAQLDKTLSKGQVTMGQFLGAKFQKNSAAAAQVMSLANARAAALETQFIATGAAANGFREAIAIRPLQAFNKEAVVSVEKLAIQRAMLRQATTSLINFGKNTQWAGRQLMVGFTVPLSIFAAAAGKTFMDLEKQALAFRKVYGDAFTTPEELNQNIDAVKKLSAEFTKYGIAVSDTMNLAAQAAAAGSKNADLIDATTESTRLATLGQLDQQKALETTIALQSAFGLSGQKLTKTINYMNMVENQTVLTLQDLTEAIPRVAPVINGLGGSVEDMAIMLTAMKEGGVSAAQGANALKSGLGSLINPTDKAVASLQKMGINLNYIIQANRGDLMATVKGFAEALSTLDEFSRQQALEQVFGKFQYARLGALFNNIIRDGSQASRAMDAAAMSAQGLADTANKELKMIEESPATKFTAAMERLKLSIAPIGELFVKMATPIINFISSIVDKFNNLPDFAKNFIALGTVVTGVVIPAGTMFLGLLMNLIGTLVKFGSTIGIAFKGFTSGGIKGAIKAVSQSMKYMGLAEIDAVNAAKQLSGATVSVNEAMLAQATAADGATSGIMELATAYRILAEQMDYAASSGPATFGVPGTAMRRARTRRTFGGRIPGSGSTDKVPAMLTPGEFVINKEATQQNLGLLKAINDGEIQKFQFGGVAAILAANRGLGNLVQSSSSRVATAGLTQVAGRYEGAYAQAHMTERKIVVLPSPFNPNSREASNWLMNRIPGKSKKAEMARELARRGLIGSALSNDTVSMPRIINDAARTGSTQPLTLSEAADILSLPGSVRITPKSAMAAAGFQVGPNDELGRQIAEELRKIAIVNGDIQLTDPILTAARNNAIGNTRLSSVRSFTTYPYAGVIQSRELQAYLGLSSLIDLEEVNRALQAKGHTDIRLIERSRPGGKVRIELVDKSGNTIIEEISSQDKVRLNKGNIVPGSGNKDTVPAMLTPGEFVVNKEATRSNMPLLNAINSGEVVGFNRGGQIPGVQYFGFNMLPRIVQPFKQPNVSPILNPYQQSSVEGKLATWLGGSMDRVNVRELAKLGLAANHPETELFRGMVLKPRESGGSSRFSPEIHDAFYRYAKTGNVEELSSIIGKPIAIGPRSFSKSRKATREFSEIDKNSNNASFTFKIRDERGIYGIDPYQKVGTNRQSGYYKEQKKSYKKEKEIIPLGRPEKGRTDVVVGRIVLDKDGTVVIDVGAKLSKREISLATKEYDKTISARKTPRTQIIEVQKEGQRLQDKFLNIRSKGDKATSKEAGDLFLEASNLESKILSRAFVPATKRDKADMQRVGEIIALLKKDLPSIFNRAKALGLNIGGTVPGVGNTDTVPAMLTPGEFVVNKKASLENIALLNAINSGSLPGFANGGGINIPTPRAVPGLSNMFPNNGPSSPLPVNIQEVEGKKASGSFLGRMFKGSSVPGRGMGMGMGLGMMGGAMMMAPMIPGVSQNPTLAGGLAGAGMGISMLSMLPMLGVGGPVTLAIGGVVAGLAGLGLAIKSNMEAQDEASRKAAELGANLGGTANALSKVGAALGVATPVQRQAQMQLGITDKGLSEAAAQFADIIQGPGFQGLIEELKVATSADRMTKLTDYLRNAVAAGMMKEEDAKKLAKVIGLMLQDPAVGAGVATALKDTITGPAGLLKIAEERAAKLQGTTEMQTLRSNEKFTQTGGQEASKIIGGAFQVIQDAANAEALARQQFAEGIISQETLTDVVAKARDLQNQYNTAIGDALIKTNDFGSTMQGVKDQLLKSGLISEDIFTKIDDAINKSRDLAVAQAGMQAGETPWLDVMNAQGQMAGLPADTPNIRQNWGNAKLIGESAQKFGDITVNEFLDGMIKGANNATVSALATLGEDLTSAVMQNPQMAQNYADLATRLTTDTKLQSQYAQYANMPNITSSQAMDAMLFEEKVLAGGVAGISTAGKGPRGGGTTEATRTVRVMTEFVSEGGTPAEFDTFISSIPEEKRTQVVAAFDDMDQADREAWMKDFNTIQADLGPELATAITLSAEYQEGGKGTREGIMNGVKQFNQLPSFVDKKAIYSLETNDGKNPLSRKEAEARVKSYNKIFKDMGSKNKAIRQKAELELASRYNGEPVTQQQLNGITKEVKNWNKLDVQSREEIISTTFDVQANFKINGEFYGLKGVDATAPLKEIKKQIEAQMETLKGTIATIKAAGGDTSQAEARLAKYEKAWGVVTEGIQKVNNIASGGPGNKTGGSGSGGSGAKSIAQQLTEDLKAAIDMLKSLRKVVDSKGFKAFIAGPFAPEFIEYLRQQGKEGLKVLQGGLDKIKKEYEKFKKLQITQAVTDATVAPMLRQAQMRQQQLARDFQNSLRNQGFTPGEIDYITQAIPQEQLDALAALQAEKAKIMKDGVISNQEKERLAEINVGIKAITANIKDAAAAAAKLKIVEEIDSATAQIVGAGQSLSDFISMSNNLDPQTAALLQEMGLSFDAINVKGKGAKKAVNELIEAAKAMRLAESIKGAMMSLVQMNDELKTTNKLMGMGYSAEFADELKQLGVNTNWTTDQIKEAAKALQAMKIMQTLTKTEIQKTNESLASQATTLQSQLDAYQRNTTKPLEDSLQAINDIISAKQRDIELEDRKKATYEDDIKILEEQKQTIQEVYDQRVKALEKVAQINERIAQQEQDQLDIASALSRGDVAGAAQAMLAAQKQAAQNRIEDTKNALQAQYEADQLSIEEQIAAKRNEIANIDDKINTIQGEIRKKQDDAYDKQKDINDAKKEEAKMQEKLYKIQLAQSILATQEQIRNAAKVGDVAAVGFGQEQLKAQLGIAGADQAAQEAFFNGISGGRGVIQAAYAPGMTGTPQAIVDQAMADLSINMGSLRDFIMKSFSLTEANDPASNMPAALRGLVQSAYNTAEAFTNPATGLPYTAGEILSVLGQNGFAGTMSSFLQGEFDTSINSMGTMLQGFSEKMVGIGSITDDIVKGFKAIRAAINEKIDSAKAAIAELHKKITEANNTRIQVTHVWEAAPTNSGVKKPYFGGPIKMANGSFVPGIGNTDKVPALLTPGEFVVRKSVASEYGNLLQAMNSNAFPSMKMFAGPSAPKSSGNTKNGIQYNYEVNVNLNGADMNPDDVAKAVMHKIKRSEDRLIRGTTVG